MVDVSVFDPVKDSFFKKHISSKTLGLFNKRINTDFQAAYADFRDAELIFSEAFRALPAFAPGSSAATEKAAAIARSAEIAAQVRASGQSTKAAVESCKQGTTDMLALARSLGGIMDRAVKGAPGEGAAAIALEKQLTVADLNTLTSRFQASAQKTLAKLRDAKPEAWAATPPVMAFQKEIAILRDRIAAVPEKGTELAAARKTLATLRSEMERLFDTQVLAVAAYSGSDGFAAVVEDAAAESNLRAALDDAREQARLMTTWQVPGAEGVAAGIGPLADQLGALFGKAAQGQDPAKLKADRDKLLKALEDRAAEARKLIAARRAEFAKRLASVQRRFQTVQTAFDHIDDSTLLPEQAKLIRKRLGAAGAAVTDLNGFNTKALDAASILIDDCAALVMDAQKAAQLNGKITTKLRTLGNSIEHGTSSEHPLADRLKQLLAEGNEIGKTWPTLTLADAAARVDEFEARVKAELALDGQIIRRRDTARRALTAARLEQKAVDKKYADFIKARTGKKVKAYAGQPVTDLDQAARWIETKTVLSFYDTIDTTIKTAHQALRDLSANLDRNGALSPAEVDKQLATLGEDRALLQARLDAAGKGAGLTALEGQRDKLDAQIAGLQGTKALVEDADKQAKAAEAEKAARAKLLSDSEAYGKSITGMMGKAKPGNPFHDYKDEIQGHLDRLATTRKAIKSMPLEQAQKELSFVRQMISDIAARGEKVRPRNLDKIGQQWAAAVGVFKMRVDELQAKVDDFAKNGGPSDAPDKLKSALKPIIDRLDGKAFDAVAKDLADPAKAKAARETALRKVRVLQDIVRKDPVIQQCVKNPFAVKGFASDLDRCLRQIELNVLRGV